MRWLLVGVVLAGCAGSNSVQCDDGRTCPGDRVCDLTHSLCVLAEQATVCVGKPDGEACTASTIDGHCLDEVCLPSVCGDGIIEFGEMCDDHNTVEKDMCSADCTSTRVCGNGVTDPDLDEQCDDGNRLDHDGCSSQCLTESAHWVERTFTPGARYGTAAAYDSRRGRVVVFGGFVGSAGQSGETIEWTGADWIRVKSQGPSPRQAVAAAYDSDRGETVLFGGFDGTNDLADTWTYDGVAWRQHNTPGPTERYGAVMAHDPKRHVTVLFGGFNDYNQELDDTWEWNGSTWTQITTSPKPPKRVYAAAAYDPKRGAMVLTGGGTANAGNLRGDTWTYDGQWHDVTLGPQPTLWWGAMAYDAVGQRMLHVGGFNGSTEVDTVWSWNGTTWTNLGPGTPTGRYGHVLASTGSQIVLFGGSQSGGVPAPDTWLFTTSWAQPQGPLGRNDMLAVNDYLDARAIFYGGSLESNGSLPTDTWERSMTGFQRISLSGPAPRSGHMMSWDDARDVMVVYGGLGTSGALADTWTASFLGGTTTWSWSQKLVAPNPGPIDNAVMGFDGSRVILFRASADTADPLGETWAWDGLTWSKLAVAGPTDRISAAMGYDPVRKQLVMFGGYGPDASANGSEVPLDDTWVWNGTSWQKAMTPFRPGRRSDAALAWNPTRQRLVLVGGYSSALDAFEWDGASWVPIAASNVPTGRGASTAVASPDGAGIFVLGGTGAANTSNQQWELRWEATPLQERCDGSDADQDNLRNCADPDCWFLCTPLCPPGIACDPSAAPRCGDGTCQLPRESCRTCAADCMPCTPVCGDSYCDQGETGCPGDCP